MTSIEIGFTISVTLSQNEGISVDPENIEAIMNWPTLRNVIDVIYSMGIIGY